MLLKVFLDEDVYLKQEGGEGSTSIALNSSFFFYLAIND